MVKYFKKFVSKENLLIITNASSLVGTTAVTTLFGFIFWWVAARRFTPEAVGFASAAISLMNLLGTLGMVGLGTLLMGELPRQPGNAGPLISTALVVTGIIGFLLGLGFCLVAPFLTNQFEPLRASFYNISLFSLGVSLTSITNVLDQALTGLFRSGLQLWRNLVFSAGKLALLALLSLLIADRLGLNIYLTWLLGNLLSLAVLFVSLLVKKVKISSCWPKRQVLEILKGNALNHHILNLALLAPTMLLPAIVTGLLSATTNAYFYTAWMLAHLVFTCPYTLTLALYALGSQGVGQLQSKMRFTLPLAFAAGVAANLFLVFGARILLNFFGANYANAAENCLRLLGLGVFPLIIKDHYIAVRRIKSEMMSSSILVAAGSFFELVVAGIGASLGGLTGLSLGWVIALTIEAVVMFPEVYNTVVGTNKLEKPVPGQRLSRVQPQKTAK